MRALPPHVVVVLLLVGALALAGRRDLEADARLAERARAYVVEHDPRRMSAREFRQIPGIGATLGVALVRARDAHHGRAPLALEEVEGIGEVRAGAIRSWARAHGAPSGPLAPGRYPLCAMRALPWPIALALVAAGCLKPDGPSPSPPDVHVRALLGGSLHALESGPADGALVLFLHGARYSAEDWDQLGTLALLGRAGWHCVALDWPGYGRTAAWKDEPEAGTLLLGVCDALGAARAVVVAPSLGGLFALDLLRVAPERVRALIALAPAGAAELGALAPKVPTLLVWGENDEVVPVDVGRALVQRLPEARLEVLAGATHPSYREQPERFHALLTEFLASLRDRER